MREAWGTAIVDKEMLWRQFRTAIDRLRDALRDCPDELWEGRLWGDQPDQWMAAGFSSSGIRATIRYSGWHRASSWAQAGLAPSVRFDLVETEAGEVLPRTYAREVLLRYLEGCRRRCKETARALSSEQACPVCRFSRGELPFAELLLYTMRHVREHSAQLLMFLGQ